MQRATQMSISEEQVLQLKHLRIRYPLSKIWILNGLNLSLQKGERLALIGPSGCGKSTLTKAIMNLLPTGSICQGEIRLAGKNPQTLNKNKLRELRGEAVGLIFQDPMSRLNPLITVGGHLLDTLQAHLPKTNPEWRKQKAKRLLEKVGIDSSRFNAYPHELSGGMRQRLGIALAIALKPPLIIADEPTTSLDVVVADKIMGQLNDLCNELGVALLLISHDLALAARWCQHIAILDEGIIIEKDLSERILLNPQSLTGKRLLKAARAKEAKANQSLSKQELALEIINLRCWYSQGKLPWSNQWIKAVDGINLSLHVGESLGIVGKSGCGKSTLCRALIGLTPIRGGLVKLEGQSILNMSGKELQQARQKIQMVFQDPSACLNPRMTVGEAIADPLLIHKICKPRQAKERALELLEEVGLTPSKDFQHRLPNELSGGQQQRIIIARSIALRPKVLICDESVSMLDPEIQHEILSLLYRLQKKLGLAILFITHDLVVASSFCERIIVLHQGQVLEEGSSDQVLKSPNNEFTQNLVNSSPRLPI